MYTHFYIKLVHILGFNTGLLIKVKRFDMLQVTLLNYIAAYFCWWMMLNNQVFTKVLGFFTNVSKWVDKGAQRLGSIEFRQKWNIST